MGKVKLPYYVVKHGRGYWQPTKAMRAFGFHPVVCGLDGPAAWAKAEAFNRKWQLARRGLEATSTESWPKGSLGEAFLRLRRTGEWARMEPRTREDWERGQKALEPVFGTVAPSTVSFEHIDLFYARWLERKGVSEAYRAIKHWRRLWVKMAAMGYCVAGADPSKGLRRLTPSPRSQTWREGEAVRLVKQAIRSRYHGLACIIAVAWDTQFSPVDVRTLTASHLFDMEGRLVFHGVQRAKTDKPALGTVSRRVERLIRTYLATLGAEPLPDAPLFRHRQGAAYSKDTLGDDFRTVREIAFPGDQRRLMDMRRSGAFEAAAGGVDPNALAAKMANTINRSHDLQRTYQPVSLAAVKMADEARKVGRRRMRETE